MCLLAMRLHVLPSHLEAEGPEVIATMLDLLAPARPASTLDEEEELAMLWPVEAMA